MPGPVATSGIGTAFGTFGELLQGALPERDGDFLVTLPIARWSVVRFDVLPGMRGLEVRPAHKVKSLSAAGALLRALGLPAAGRITVESGMPEGKGLASSSADLVATLRAVANAVGEGLPEELVGTVLRGIEPTDGVMYPAVVAYHHRRARLREVLGSLPEATVVGWTRAAASTPWPSTACPGCSPRSNGASTPTCSRASPRLSPRGTSPRWGGWRPAARRCTRRSTARGRFRPSWRCAAGSAVPEW
ncbi:hypothetical protein HFP72_29410 [Nocardiopsis sp. ARC36]